MKRLLQVAPLLFLFPAVGCTPENMYPSIAYVSQSLETASGEFNAGVQRLAEGHAVLLEATQALARVAAPEAVEEIAALQARLDESDKRYVAARLKAADLRADDAEADADLLARVKTMPGIGSILASMGVIGGGATVGGTVLSRLVSGSGKRLTSIEALINRFLPSPLAPGNGNGNGGTPA